MQLSILLAETAGETTELPADPMVFGGGAFLVFMALIVGLLMFGKGRPHS